MRLACLYALADMSSFVGRSHLLAGLEVWRYCFESARYIFGSRLGDVTADAIWRALRAVSPGGLTLTDVSQNVFHRNVGAKELRRAFALLEQYGLVRRERNTDTGGRPSETWFATQQDLRNYITQPVASVPAGSQAEDAEWGEPA
jgi:hypothetical protein